MPKDGNVVPLAPLSLKGRTLILDQSRAEYTFHGSQVPDFWNPEWRKTFQGWNPLSERPDWKIEDSFVITADAPARVISKPDELIYIYQRLTPYDAQVTFGRADFIGPDKIVLKFITPTEAEAMYCYCGGDIDGVFVRNVRVTIK
jgi:hypothetical protein